MILYSIKCSNNHVFKEWFLNYKDCDLKIASNKINCPECNDHRVTKEIMAPFVGKNAQKELQCCQNKQSQCKYVCNNN
ncbi:MAG: DUF1178 family protein [Rhodospirillaceae bacterium]|jgi:hypothetical protein|nr:DUF1178 family protein [Rhodospirillaceae bacterium]